MALSPKEKKLLSDPSWRLDNLYKIKTKNQQTVRFKKNNIQQLLHDNSTGLDVVLKARQVGVSTYYLLKKLDKCIFTPNYTAAILSHERKSMEILFSIIRRAIKYMHPHVKPVIAKGGGSIYQIIFPEIESKIYATMEGVSDTINDLHVSEMALMDNADRVKTSMDAVPIGGNISIETTARGFNHFYDFWNEHDSLYQKHFFPWYLHEEYQISTQKFKLTDDEKKLKAYAKKAYGINLTYDQIAFRRFKIKQKDNDLDNFKQEFPEDPVSCFIASGQNFFDQRIIAGLRDELPPATDGHLKIFKEYNKAHDYACGADTAEGVGGDYSVATMIDVTTMEQVAELRGQFKPSDFAHEINNLCKMYHTGGRVLPYLGIEKNNHGHAVLLELAEHIKYPNLFSHKPDTPGWLTDRVTKPIMLNALKDGLENRTFKPNSHDLISEALTFVNDNGKLTALEGKHDDCIIAAAIALQLAINSKSFNYDNIENRILI